MAKTKTEQLSEEIARLSYEFGSPRTYFNWDTIQEKDKSWYRRMAAQILKSCKDAGLVMLSEDQTGLPTYLVDAPNIRRVEEIESNR